MLLEDDSCFHHSSTFQRHYFKLLRVKGHVGDIHCIDLSDRNLSLFDMIASWANIFRLWRTLMVRVFKLASTVVAKFVPTFACHVVASLGPLDDKSASRASLV